MKKFLAFALIAVMAVSVFTACRRPADDATTGSTTASTVVTTVPTTAPTTATTVMPTLPGDTLDSTGPSTAATGKMMPRR